MASSFDKMMVRIELGPFSLQLTLLTTKPGPKFEEVHVGEKLMHEFLLLKIPNLRTKDL